MIAPPSSATLKKYGLAPEEWLKILESQGWVCAICKKAPSTGRFVTDHFHARNYKKMPPEQKKLWVRGVLCWFCNESYVGRAITVEKAHNVVTYLEAFEARRPSK
jgi:hypothetical protein